MQCAILPRNSGFVASGNYADMIVAVAEGTEWVSGHDTAKDKIYGYYPVLPLKSLNMPEIRAATWSQVNVPRNRRADHTPRWKIGPAPGCSDHKGI